MTRTPQWLITLVRGFVAGDIDAATFVLAYQKNYSGLPLLGSPRFPIVDRLFFVCEEYYPDHDLRRPGDTTDEELLAGAQRALRELEALGD